jgi:hypothetical protein
MKTATLEDDADFLSDAGPAVLRLKLLEATHVLQTRNPPEEIRAQTIEAVAELRRLIAERPCVSLIDRIAKEKTLGAFEQCDPLLDPCGVRAVASA